MNLWLKDGAKKLGMRWTWKQKAEKAALLCLQGAALHVWLQPELYQYNCNNFSTKSIQRFSHMMIVTDTSFGHAVCLFSLMSISQVLFLLLWEFSLRTIQCVSWARVGCMLSIHPVKQTPRLEVSLLPYHHILEFGCSFEFSFANGVKWKQLKPTQSQRLGYSHFLWLNRKWVD